MFNPKNKNMKKSIIYIVILLTSVVTITSCEKKKDETPQPTSAPLSFTSLSAAQSTIAFNQNTLITATATGEGLTYTWTLSGTGSLIGSGHQITYQPCCSGEQTINCLVKDKGGNEQSKSVIITVQ
jgi:hypothetical protein